MKLPSPVIRGGGQLDTGPSDIVGELRCLLNSKAVIPRQYLYGLSRHNALAHEMIKSLCHRFQSDEEPPRPSFIVKWPR